MFGAKFLDLGVRGKDRDINRRLKIYKDWVIETVKKRIEEVKSEENENKEHSNLI